MVFSSEPGYGSPLQDSCLRNCKHRGAWRATVRGIAESRTRLCTHLRFFPFSSYRVINKNKTSLGMGEGGTLNLESSHMLTSTGGRENSPKCF